MTATSKLLWAVVCTIVSISVLHYVLQYFQDVQIRDELETMCRDPTVHGSLCPLLCWEEFMRHAQFIQGTSGKILIWHEKVDFIIKTRRTNSNVVTADEKLSPVRSTRGIHYNVVHEARQGRVRELEKVQRLGMRLITAAFHTTPTMAMEMALGFEPVDIRVAMEAVSTAVRLKKEGNWRERVIRGHGKSHGRLCEDLIQGIAGLNKEADWISPNGIERKGYRIIIRDRQRAMTEEASIEGVKMYTDGSRMGNKTGMGFLIQVPGEEDVEVSVPLGETPTVYQAE
ncbi:unnamed protein product, partial [Cyprideis torosa]